MIEGVVVCRFCREEKPKSDFYPEKRHRTGVMSVCRVCHRRRCNDYTARTRLAVIKFYSNGTNSCACCGEGIYEFLAIDHISGGGNEHRRKTVGKSGNFYRWLIREGFPDGYRILCHNCNLAKGFYGVCPHELQSPSQ